MDVGIAYVTLFEVGILHFSSMEVVVLTCWLSVEAVVTYMYSWSWEVKLRSPVTVYDALGGSFTSLVLDWYATLSVIFILFLFFLRHTNTVTMMTAAVMSTNSLPPTPTPTNSVTTALVLCDIGLVKAAIVVTDTGGVATGSEGGDVGFELVGE